MNAVYANKVAAIDDPEERAQFVKDRRAESEADVDLLRLAAELVIDAIINPSELRPELVGRFAGWLAKPGRWPTRGTASRWSRPRKPCGSCRTKTCRRPVGVLTGLRTAAFSGVTTRARLAAAR